MKKIMLLVFMMFVVWIGNSVFLNTVKYIEVDYFSDLFDFRKEVNARIRLKGKVYKNGIPFFTKEIAVKSPYKIEIYIYDIKFEKLTNARLEIMSDKKKVYHYDFAKNSNYKTTMFVEGKNRFIKISLPRRVDLSGGQVQALIIIGNKEQVVPLNKSVEVHRTSYLNHMMGV